MSELTGEMRYRTHDRWFGQTLVVLQLEVKGFVPEPQGLGRDETWWIDAEIEHLLKWNQSVGNTDGKIFYKVNPNES